MRYDIMIKKGLVKMKQKYNYTMLCDYYELTMANGYYKNGWKDKIT